MDAALLKERDAFRKRALAQPTVERKPKASEEPASKKSKSSSGKAHPNWANKSAPTLLDYKTATPTSSHKFSILHKIIEYLKKRHHNEDNYPINLNDLLEEARMMDISQKHKQWLASEALLNNEKVEVIDGNLYKFKPKLPISNRKELLTYLKRKERKGMGGVFEDEVAEALPDYKKHVERLKDIGKITILQRSDKRRVLHFRDIDVQYKVDEEFVKLWRSVAVDGIDEKTIEDYLQKQGIASMEHVGIKRVAHPKRRGGGNRKGKNFKKLNDHLDGVLQDYSDKT